MYENQQFQQQYNRFRKIKAQKYLLLMHAVILLYPENTLIFLPYVAPFCSANSFPHIP